LPDKNIETVSKIVQKFIEKPPLIIWGLETSIFFGLSSKWNLNEILKYRNIDIESSMDKYQATAEIKRIIWDTVHNTDIKVLEKILSNDPEFNGIKVLIEKLIETHPKALNIITTNYDRVLEYILSYNNIPFTDGFSGKMLSKFDNTLFKERDMVNIIKIHGSLNWFNVNDEIRYIDCYVDKYEPQIVIPNKNRYREVYRSPYADLMKKSDSLIETASSLLVVGFEFDDEDLTSKIRTKVKRGIPIVLITEEVSKNTKEELKDANRYILLENSPTKDKTKITYKTSENTTETILEVDGSFWQLNKFIEIL